MFPNSNSSPLFFSFFFGEDKWGNSRFRRVNRTISGCQHIKKVMSWMKCSGPRCLGFGPSSRQPSWSPFFLPEINSGIQPTVNNFEDTCFSYLSSKGLRRGLKSKLQMRLNGLVGIILTVSDHQRHASWKVSVFWYDVSFDNGRKADKVLPWVSADSRWILGKLLVGQDIKYHPLLSLGSPVLCNILQSISRHSRQANEMAVWQETDAPNNIVCLMDWYTADFEEADFLLPSTDY